MAKKTKFATIKILINFENKKVYHGKKDKIRNNQIHINFEKRMFHGNKDNLRQLNPH